MLYRAVIALSLLVVSPTSETATSSTSTLTQNEYDVLAAVIDFFHASKIASQPLIANRTSTFACGTSENGMTTGGCNGLRWGKETPEDRMQIVSRDFPQVQQSTVSDFMAKNSRSVLIDPKIPTKQRYVMFSPDHAESMPSEWKNPDYFYFSRVGLNAEGTQALVAVSFFSGTNASDSGGKYVLFTKANGHWKREGSSSVWELVPPQNTRVEHRIIHPAS